MTEIRKLLKYRRSFAPVLCAQRWKFYKNHLVPFSYKRSKSNHIQPISEQLISKNASNVYYTNFLSSNNSIKDERVNEISELMREAFLRADSSIRKEKLDELITNQDINSKAISVPNRPNINPKDHPTKGRKAEMNELLKEYRKNMKKNLLTLKKPLKYKSRKHKSKIDQLNTNTYGNLTFVLPQIKDNIKGRYLKILNKVSDNEELPIIKPILANDQNKNSVGYKLIGKKEDNADTITKLCEGINDILNNTVK